MTLDYAEDFRGRLACPCQVAWLPVFEAEAQRLRILTGPLPLSQIIGTASTSGNTHATGGADDTYPLTNISDVTAYVKLSRDMGADATWLRPYNWNGAGGVAHVHRVLRGCPHNTPARYQITAVDLGYNGLGSGGTGAKDDGPRPLSGRTWREGIQWAREQADWLTMATQDELKKLLRDEVTGPLRERMNEIARGDKERLQAQTAQIAAALDELATSVADDATKRQVAHVKDLVKHVRDQITTEETP